jgi:hypothetical protein
MASLRAMSSPGRLSISIAISLSVSVKRRVVIAGRPSSNRTSATPPPSLTICPMRVSRSVISRFPSDVACSRGPDGAPALIMPASTVGRHFSMDRPDGAA